MSAPSATTPPPAAGLWTPPQPPVTTGGNGAAVVLARKSNKPGEDSLSFDVQLNSCRTLGASRGLRLNDRPLAEGGDVLVETVSGWKVHANRKKIETLIDKACDGHYSALVVYKMDRLGRRVAEVSAYLDKLAAANVRILSVVEGEFDLRDPARMTFALFLAVHAQGESQNTSTRVRNDAAERGKRGAYLGGCVAYGWEVDCEQLPGGDRIYNRTPEGAKRLRRHPAEGLVVEAMVRWALEERMGATAIARRLNDEGTTTRSGAPWNAKGVRSLLTNPLLCGWVSVTDRDPRTDRPMGWTRRPKIDANGQPIAPHEPLLQSTDPSDPNSQWSRLLAMFGPRRAVTRERSGRALLAGKVVDAVAGSAGQRCGHRMSGSANPGPKSKYQCRIGGSQPKVCAGTSVTQRPLEAWVTALMLNLVGSGDFARRHADLVAAARNRGDRHAARISAAISEAQQMVAEFTELVGSARTPTAATAAMSGLDHWSQALDAAQSELSQVAAAPTDVSAFHGADPAGCAVIFANATSDQRARWIDAIIDRIEIKAPVSGRGAHKGAFGSRGFDPRRVEVFFRHDPTVAYTAPADWKPSEPESKTQTCPEPGCRRTVASWAALAAHRRWAHGRVSQRKAAAGGAAERHCCPRCTKVCYAAAALRNHLYFAHAISDGYPCPQPGCNRSFPLPLQLGRHITTIHNDAREFCPTCGRYFKVGGLTLHRVRSHGYRVPRP